MSESAAKQLSNDPAVGGLSEASVGSPAIAAHDVWVKFRIRYHRGQATLRGAFVRAFSRARRSRDEDFWALSGIDFRAQPGDVIGLVGKNGAGKSTLLKTLAGICTADRGHVDVHGKVACLMSFGVGFRPNLTGRENAYLNGSLLGLQRRELRARMDEIIEFSELGDFIDAPVRTYSAGMRGRLGFSIAIHVRPDVLLLDEVLTVGDASFRAKAGYILDRFRQEQKTVVIASHNMQLLQTRCTRVVWLEGGKVKLDGDPKEVTAAYTEST